MNRAVLSPRMIARDAEFDLLRGAVLGAGQRRGSLTFLVGEAGIGKSRLAREVILEARRSGLTVCAGRATPRTTPVAYRPLAEACSAAVRAGAPVDDPALLPFRPLLGRLVPDWRAAGDDASDDSVVALAEAVLRFLRVAGAARGCLLVLDDLHWADPETLTVLEYLADNIAPEPVAVVATMRNEEPSAVLDLGRALHARRVAALVALPRLDDGAVGEMVRSCLDVPEPDAALSAFVARAEGVPFLVEEMLADAVARGALVERDGRWTPVRPAGRAVPLTFAETVRRRLALLGEDARSVVVAAAVLGRNFDWALLPAITGLDRTDVLQALRAAISSQLVSVDPETGSFRFRHALSRDAVVAELLPPELGAWSKRALDALGDVDASLPGAACALAAELAAAAGDGARAAELLLEVGRRALARGALTSAQSALERAWAAAPDGLRVDVAECLTEARSMAGRLDEAVESGAAALAALAALGRDGAQAARRASIHLRLARCAVAATRWHSARRSLAAAREEAARSDDEALAARIDAVAAQAAVAHDPDAAHVHASAAVAAASRLGLPEVACEALEVVGRLERPRDLDAAERAFARAYALAGDHHLTVWRVRAMHELGTIDLLRGRDLDRLEEARALASDQGALATAAVIDVQIAAAYAMRDDPSPALERTHRAADLAGRLRITQTLAAALAFEAHVHARAGRRDLTMRCIDRSRAAADGSPEIEVILQFAAGILALVEEDRAAALLHLGQAAAIASSPVGDQSSGPPIGCWALVRAVASEDSEQAVIANEPVHVLARGYIRYARAVVAGRGRTAAARREAERLALDADAHFGAMHWHRHVARRLAAEAALADGWGDPVGWLRGGLACFDARGEVHLASACRALLRRAGAPVPRRRGAGTVPDTLGALGITVRETEVLRLLGDGLSNHEIATRLFLSPRTVERHVANLSAKVGVERRSQLVAFAARSEPRHRA